MITLPDASRVAFEMWARSKNMAMTMSEGTLEDCAATLLAWGAWQASRKQALEEALNCYSPDDTATDWSDKIRNLK